MGNDTVADRRALLTALEPKARRIAWLLNGYVTGLHFAGKADIYNWNAVPDILPGIPAVAHGREDFSDIGDPLYGPLYGHPHYLADGSAVFQWSPYATVVLTPQPMPGTNPKIELLPPVTLDSHSVGGYSNTIPNPDDAERTVSFNHGVSHTTVDKTSWAVEASAAFKQEFSYAVGKSEITAGIKASGGGEQSASDTESEGANYNGVVPPKTERTFTRLDTIARQQQTLRVTGTMGCSIKAVSDGDYTAQWASWDDFRQCWSGVGAESAKDGQYDAPPPSNWGYRLSQLPVGQYWRRGDETTIDIAAVLADLTAPIIATSETTHQFEEARKYKWAISDVQL